MASTTADRLGLLQDHVRLSLLERKRALSMGVEPDARNTREITQSLDTLLAGIEQLEKEQKQIEEGGELSSQAIREREDILIRLRSQYDSLHSQFTTPASSTQATDSISAAPHARPTDLDTAAREALMTSRETPSALRKSKTVRFTDNPDVSNSQVLLLHSRVMDEQDESLDRLSESIRNQRELSIQIGDELESQVLLLDDVDDLVDRHQSRLDGAKKRLGGVAQGAKEHGSLVIIGILICVLIILILVVKW